ncbi:LPXTG-motif cell wall-anchored protein [Streptomyces sp. B3I7]|uniref:LPXTG cell wall anchor domain-containing protein n=1 Tax=Streptomyces sp. B3I7 TaxID=3042269 RepID=UPI002781AE6E|nr:LPXTG cell wall anchor domain-containing protein [Streptomyces sp. B3I7]MDQ0811562.1 LPXTG-motif cell wall-anchored protein [Streptomyces sp. B3I7]
MSAARRSSSTARRSLLTATAAGTMLAALWFVPSANASQGASQESSTVTGTSAVTRTSTGTAARTSTDTTSTGTTTDTGTATDTAARTAHAAQVPASESTGGGGSSGETGKGTATEPLGGLDGPADTRLADTGSIDTTPYVIGGTLLLGLGAGFVAFSVRRERATAY